MHTMLLSNFIAAPFTVSTENETVPTYSLSGGKSHLKINCAENE